MDMFAVLSGEVLFREESSWERCYQHLAGVSLESLQRYASNFCHRLTHGDALYSRIEDFQEFQRWFLTEFSSRTLSDTILGLLGHRRAYRGQTWALTDAHRVANLVGAYMVANPAPSRDEARGEDQDRLIRAQLMVNDLVASSSPESPEEGGEAEVLKLFSMAQRPNIESHLPRTFDLFAERLAGKCTNIEKLFRTNFGVDFIEILVILFSLYNHFLTAIDPEKGARLPKSSWSRGVVDLSRLAPDHPGETAMRRVFDLYSCSWADLHKEISVPDTHSISILPFLRHPLIRLDEHTAWCFDPGLVLTAGTNGLFWLAVKTSNGADLIRKLGGVFEQYLADFFEHLAPERIRRGDTEAQGLPDFFWVEDDVLIAIEVKASVMRDEVKWGGDRLRIQEEMEKKIIKGNQLPAAVKRVVERDRKLQDGIRRIVPVFVVLDMSFSSPGLETVLNEAFTKPTMDATVDDAHLLWVGELEIAGNAIREGVFSKLLGARERARSFHGYVSIGELLRNHMGTVVSRVGRRIEPYDAQGPARIRLDQRMVQLAEALSI